MDALSGFIDFLVLEVFSKPAYLVGLMTAIGLIALRKGPGEIIGGALKATMGFLILGLGATAVINALAPLGDLILGVTGAQGVVPTNEAIVALAQANYGYVTAWVMFLGFLASLVIARVTPLRYVFLTGHHIFYMATMLAVILVTVELSDIWTVVVGSILLGTIMVIMPAFAQPWMSKVTGGEAVAMGHFGSTGYILAGIVGQATPRSRSTEAINFPQQLRFLREPMVATAVSMMVIYLIFAIAYLLLKGEAAALENFAPPNANWGSFLMAQFANALQFGVGVAVILLGVRTILGEIVPAFAGISERIVPGALPALDCPVAFPYAPNAVIIGFLASVVGGLVSLGLIGVLFQPDAALGGFLVLALILPGMVPHFFTGGAAGVFGNATGGMIGATLGGFANGVLITFLPAFLLKVLGDLGFANTTFGDADFGWFGILVGNVSNWVKANEPVIIVAMLVISVVLLALASIWQIRVVNRGWIPGGAKPVEEEAAA